MPEPHQQESLHFLDYWRVIVARKEIVLAVALLVILAGVLVTYSMKKVYMASCVIKVEEERPDVSVFTPEMMRFDPLFLRTQFEILTSKPILHEEINRLNLEESWGKEGEVLPRNIALKILQNSIDVFQQRDTLF